MPPEPIPSQPKDDATPKRKRNLPLAERRRRQPAVNKAIEVEYSASKLADAYRGRELLNRATIAEMHRAFAKGGRKAIEQVMKNQPAIFLKLLVLLVPRELQIEHRGGVKGMTEEQIIDAIEAIEAYLARRSGEAAKVIEAEPLPQALPSEKSKSKSD